MDTIRCNSLVPHTHQGGRCQKSAKFRYEFQHGKCEHSCGNRYHSDDILSKMGVDDSVRVFVFDRSAKQFIESHTLNCFNIVFESKLFYGPYSEKETYLKDLKIQSIRYSKLLIKHQNTLEVMTALQEEVNWLRARLESPFLSISEEEYETMSKRLVFAEMAIMHNANDMASIIESERTYLSAKERYESVLVFSIPWVIEEDTDQCSICFDDVRKESGGQIFCGHSFHNECLRSWLKRRNTCPICREDTYLQQFLS